MEKNYKFKKSLFELYPELITNQTGLNILLAYNLNGIFGNSITEFYNLNKISNNFVSYFTLNNFYVYCTDEKTKTYFEQVKNWGINIIKICNGEIEFFDKKATDIPDGYIKKGKKFVQKFIKTITYPVKKPYKEFFMPKFDLSIMNPPYDHNLHMEILEKVKDHSNKTICIHPADKYQNKIKNQINLSFGVTDIKLIEQDKFNEIFGTSQWIDGCITTIEQNNINNDYTKFLHLVKYYDLYVKIKNKIPDLIKTHLVNEPNEFSLRYFVGCHWDNYHDFEGTAKSYKYACMTNNVGHTKYLNCIDENNRKNLFNSGFTKFFKFCVYLDAINIAPYMIDYSQPWTDKRFCEYFGITGYISDTKAENGSEWEIILNTLKDYK